MDNTPGRSPKSKKKIWKDIGSEEKYSDSISQSESEDFEKDANLEAKTLANQRTAIENYNLIQRSKPKKLLALLCALVPLSSATLIFVDVYLDDFKGHSFNSYANAILFSTLVFTAVLCLQLGHPTCVTSFCNDISKVIQSFRKRTKYSK